MKQMIITAKEQVEYQEKTLQSPGVGEVLVQVKAVGLCTFEQRYYSGGKEDYPFHGGHEVCGVVEAIGPEHGGGLSVGDRVVVAAITRCGECYYCQRGYDNMCENGGDVMVPGEPWGPGGLSEYMLVKGYQVYKISDSVDFAVGTLAEPLACVLRSVEKGNVGNGDSVLITGAGIMGLLHVMVAKQNGLFVMITEVDESRKQKALELGADVVIDPTKEDVLAEVKARTGGRGVEAVFYTAGGQKAAEQGIEALAKGATIVFYGAIYPKGPMAIDPNKIHYDEINLTGLVSTTRASFLQSARMLSENMLDLRAFISEEYPFDEGKKAFDRACSPDTYRVAVRL